MQDCGRQLGKLSKCSIYAKTFLMYNKMYAKRTRSFFVTARMQFSNSVRMKKITLLLRKSCSVHMTVFEIVAHCNVDNWIQLLT